MNTYTVLLKNETIMDNATIKQFLVYIEDTEQFENWFYQEGIQLITLENQQNIF